MTRVEGDVQISGSLWYHLIQQEGHADLSVAVVGVSTASRCLDEDPPANVQSHLLIYPVGI